MSAHSRRKGASGEREIVALAQSLGLSASREWQNAQHGDPGVRAVDVRIGEHRAQVKRTAAGHKALYDSLAGVDFLFVRADGREWIAVLAAEKLLKMLHGRENPILAHKQTESKDVTSAGRLIGTDDGTVKPQRKKAAFENHWGRKRHHARSV